MSQWKTFDTIPVKEMFFETEAEANKVILDLFDIVEKYGFASVADYYDLCGASWENDICSKYGWNILAGMRTIKAEDKEFFTILLPSPRPLEEIAKKSQQGFEKNDAVNHPQHYTAGGIECIDAISSAISCQTDPVNAFLTGQVIKYIWRFPLKNGLEDLKKAQWYLNRLIEKETKNG